MLGRIKKIKRRKGQKMTFEDAANKALAFREERDLAISISLEAAELLENFQWSGTSTDVAGKRDNMAEELADVAIYCIYFADALDIDLAEAIGSKIDANSEKYPVEKSRGKSTKYTEL